MLIKRMNLVNFRQFKDREVIEFSTNKDSNITLILGNNTSGKTTLLQGFKWCFYGKTTFDSKDKIFNEMNANLMQENAMSDVIVKVELQHNDLEYIVTRTHSCIKQNNVTRLVGNSKLEIVRKQVDGQTRKIDPLEVNAVMNEILPEKISDYFFYDTERFGNITEKEDVTEAVKGLLGLTVLENAVDHLGKRTQSRTVIGQFHNELDQQGNKKLQEALREAEHAESEINRLEKLIKEQETEVENYESKQEKEKDKLRAAEATMELQREKEKAEQKMKSAEIAVITNNKQFLSSFQSNSFSYFSSTMIKRANTFLQEAEVSDKGIRDMNANSIDDILKRGYCVCGTGISLGSSAYANLNKMKEYLPPQSLGGMIRNFQRTAKVYFNSTKSYYSTLEQNYINIIKSRQTVENYYSDVEAKSREIKGIDEAKNSAKRLDDINQNIKSIRGKIAKNMADKEIQNRALIDAEKKHKANLNINKENKEKLILRTYAERVLEWIGNSYNKREGAIRKELEEKVTLYFTQIYHGKRKVVIDDRYRVSLVADVLDAEVATDESAGLETVKNFAFIAGLVHLAKEKLELEKSRELNENPEEGEDYPLVLDAPFSNVDVDHVLNISRILPKVAGQLVLIVMAKDWNYAKDELTAKVGKSYQLEKLSEIHTKIIPN